MCLEDFVFVFWLSWVAISWHCKAGVLVFALFLGLQQFFLGLVKVAALTTFFTDPSSKAEIGCQLGSGRSTRRCTIFLTSRWPCTLPDVQERDQTVAGPNSGNAEHTGDWRFSSFAIPPWKCEGFGIKVKFLIYLLCCFDLCVCVFVCLIFLVTVVLCPHTCTGHRKLCSRQLQKYPRNNFGCIRPQCSGFEGCWVGKEGGNQEV